MNKEEILHYWLYFCSLCSQLEQTTEYVDHSTIEQDGKTVLINGDVYSNEFLKLLFLAGAEFENIGKLICKEIDPTFIDKNENIKTISKRILMKYPKIGETIVLSNYQGLRPFEKWKVAVNDEGQEFVEGLEWWDSYTGIKHKRYECFISANLKNCIDALASLFVLELYLAMQALSSVSDLAIYGCKYFHFIYGHIPFMVKSEITLPDFPNEIQ